MDEVVDGEKEEEEREGVQKGEEDVRESWCEHGEALEEGEPEETWLYNAQDEMIVNAWLLNNYGVTKSSRLYCVGIVRGGCF